MSPETDPTAARLAEIEARLAAATPGPWHWNYDGPSNPVVLPQTIGNGIIALIKSLSEYAEADANLITAASTDLTFCFTLIRAQRERIAELEAENKDLRAGLSNFKLGFGGGFSDD